MNETRRDALRGALLAPAALAGVLVLPKPSEGTEDATERLPDAFPWWCDQDRCVHFGYTEEGRVFVLQPDASEEVRSRFAKVVKVNYDQQNDWIDYAQNRITELEAQLAEKETA